MAINLADNNPRVVYTVAEGVTQTTFAVPFEFFEDADVNIYVDNVLKAEGTDYTLTGGDGATGTLTFVPADPGDPQQVTGAVGGSTVVLVRRIAIERTTDFQQGMDISRPALNSQLDVLTALVADMNDRWDRAVHLDDADTGQVNFILPSSSVRAGNYFAFDANGDPVMTAGTTSDIIVSAFAETFLDDNTAQQVLNTLGINATATELNLLSGQTSLVPAGVIVMWSGSIASIPSGWFLCDGANGTPDLRDRFVVGAGSTYAVNDTGGANSVTLDTSQIPSHTHTATVNDPGHSHTVDGATQQTNGGGTIITGRNNVVTSSVATTGITVTNSATGGGGSHENRPPYFALAYIMKS
jgi:hypothetical protein